MLATTHLCSSIFTFFSTDSISSKRETARSSVTCFLFICYNFNCTQNSVELQHCLKDGACEEKYSWVNLLAGCHFEIRLTNSSIRLQVFCFSYVFISFFCVLLANNILEKNLKQHGYSIFITLPADSFFAALRI